VRLSEGATVWSAGPNEHFDKKTGQRVGSIGRHRLLLESIKPLNSTIDEVSAQQLVALMKGKNTVVSEHSFSHQNIIPMLRSPYVICKNVSRRCSHRITSELFGMTICQCAFHTDQRGSRYYANSEKTRA
jgi:hypothetical protein